MTGVPFDVHAAYQPLSFRASIYAGECRQAASTRSCSGTHLITVAPARSGKGVGSVIPNLLTYRGSVVVTDLKGENFAVTARHCREGLHQLGRFGLAPSVHAFNPMDLISLGSSARLESASLLADMLVLPSARGGEELFWAEEAKALLSGLILHVAATETDEEARPYAGRCYAPGSS